MVYVALIFVIAAVVCVCMRQWKLAQVAACFVVACYVIAAIVESSVFFLIIAILWTALFFAYRWASRNLVE